jgi:sugar lactone lactonase YvrE
MTENVLKRAGLPPIEPTTVEPAPTVDAGNPVTARVIAGGVELGSGADTAALVASLDAPVGIATGPDGQLYVADASGFIRKISADGQVSTLAGCPPNQPSDPSCLGLPIGIAVSGDGTVYFSDASANRIYKLQQDGTLTIYAGSGSAGSGDASDPLQASFSEPRGLALDADGALYVADARNAAIRRVDEQGVTTVARDLSRVAAVAVDSNGNVYFSSMNCQVGEIADGAVQVLACPSAVNGNREGPGELAHLRPMEGLLVDGDRLVFTDTGNYRVRAVELNGHHQVSTVVGDGNASPDLATGAHLALPRGVALYDGGYAISDSANHRILWVASTR